LSNLTLGHALGSQLTILREEVRTFESIPAWLAVIVALMRILDDGSHSDFLGRMRSQGCNPCNTRTDPRDVSLRR
jgi:hypothetical protein